MRRALPLGHLFLKPLFLYVSVCVLSALHTSSHLIPTHLSISQIRELSSHNCSQSHSGDRRSDSRTDTVLWTFWERSPGRWFTHGELEWGALTWKAGMSRRQTRSSPRLCYQPSSDSILITNAFPNFRVGRDLRNHMVQPHHLTDRKKRPGGQGRD